MKDRRIEDPELVAAVRKIPCLACISMRERLSPEEWEQLYSLGDDIDKAIDASDPDHVTTRGAGGDDIAENLIPLCRQHHSERHDQGYGHMIERYGVISIWLVLAKRFDVFERAGLPVPKTCMDAINTSRRVRSGKSKKAKAKTRPRSSGRKTQQGVRVPAKR